MNINKFSEIVPSPFFDFFISIFNKYQYSVRRSGHYKEIRHIRESYDHYSFEDLKEIQRDRLIKFINYARENSAYFSEVIGDISINQVEDIKKLPFLVKSTLISRLEDIVTIKENDAIVSYTGGTTGASLKVLYTKDCMRERFAYLDHFREKFGYKLGDKVAWFSGKNFISKRDEIQKRFYKRDYINNIYFFSTFHITRENVAFYLEKLEKFQPRFLVGFPSSVYRICKYAQENGIKYRGKVSIFFPTAETLTKEHRVVISNFLGCKLINQYASSEGAPWIFECGDGNLHIDITSGVFEVLDMEGNDCNSGELVVTSFTTKGTPLIRYRIGDSLTLSNKKVCSCGSFFPIADQIEGRRDDYVSTPNKGEVNLGNLSNSTKGITGIVSFQVEQFKIDKVEVKVIATNKFNDAEESCFKTALSERLGEDVEIEIFRVKDIPVEKSGKFRIIKNHLNN